MKRKSMKIAILIPVTAVLLAGILAMCLIISAQSSRITNNLSQQLVQETVRHYAKEFEQAGAEKYENIVTIAPIITSLRGTENGREEVISQLTNIIKSNDGISALWSVWEPNTFDNKDSEYIDAPGHDKTGRFVPYVTQSGSDIQVDIMYDYDDPVLGDYYQGAKKTGKPYITDPYIWDDRMIFSISVPILEGGEVIGAIGADIDMAAINATMSGGKILEDGYLITFSPAGYVSTHSNPEHLMTHYDANWMNQFANDFVDISNNGGEKYFSVYSSARKENVIFVMKGVEIGKTGKYWNVSGIIPEKSVTAPARQMTLIIIAVGIFLILVVSGTILLLLNNLLKGLPLLTKTAEAMAEGDIDVDLGPVDNRPTKNELAILTRSFQNMVAGIRSQVDTVKTVSHGDLTVDIKPNSDRDQLNLALKRLVSSNNKVFSEILTSSELVSSGANQMSYEAQALAQSSMEQTATIQQLSAAIQQMAEKTRDNEELAVKAADVSGSIHDAAEKGSAQIEEMLSAMHGINESSLNISKVIKVIEDIAFQTNILALNAAVEAARAGQHGKGFAVVADEVRNLASKSAAAAKETSQLISGSAEKATEGMRIAEDTSASFNEILNGINETNQLVSQIPPASKEQRVTIEQISIGINQVTATIEQNSASAEESAASSEEMNAQASLLNQLVSQFKLKKSEKTGSQPSHGAVPEPQAQYQSDDMNLTPEYSAN